VARVVEVMDGEPPAAGGAREQAQEVRLQSGARGAALSSPPVVRVPCSAPRRRRRRSAGGAQACAGRAAPLLRPRASSAGLRLPARCLVARAAVFMQCWKFIWAAGRDVDAQEGDNTVALRKPQSVHPSCGLCTVVDGNAPCPKELLSWPPKSFKWFGWRDRRSTF